VTPQVNGIVSQPLAFAMLHWITRLSDTLPAAFVAGALSLLLVLFTWTGVIFLRPIVRAWLRRQVDATNWLMATAKLDAAIATSLTKAVLQNVAAIRGSAGAGRTRPRQNGYRCVERPAASRSQAGRC